MPIYHAVNGRSAALARPFLVTLLVLLVGCERSSGPEAPPTAEATDWIELPLVEGAYREHSSGYRQDTVSVTIPPNRQGLEVELGMEEGEAIVYSWRAEGLANPDMLLSEFHGHTEREPGQPGTVMFYRQATGAAEHGSLIAPFSGIHGWYFRNDSDTPVVVTITIAGFFRRDP